MEWVTTAGQFLLSQWLWNVTWGWYHVPVNVFVMLLLLKFFGYLRIMPAVLIAFFAQIFSFIALTIIVFLGPIVSMGLEFKLYDCYTAPALNPLAVSLYLGAIYCVLHIIFFLIVNSFYSLNMRLVTLIALVGNTITALLVYQFWGCHVV
jgi:hypothetical protein